MYSVRGFLAKKMCDSIPVVDVSALSVDKTWEPNQYGSVIGQIMSAFKEIGFVYLRNHGIPQATIDRLNAEAKLFFDLPPDVKDKYSRSSSGPSGYCAKETECTNPKNPGDLKEAYNITPGDKQMLPDTEVPGFHCAVSEALGMLEKLAVRILRLVALGLGLDEGLFEDAHIPLTESQATLRCLYYYPLPPDIEVKPGQLRCGEHTDFGSITLLIQDDVGGLEVKNRAGEWVAATPIPGTVLVNIADFMQRWTADVLVSTPHRVLVPDQEVLAKQKKGRQSIAFFVSPKNDSICEPVDGSGKYPPISALDYVNQRLAAMY